MGQIARWPTPEQLERSASSRIAAQAGVRTSTAGKPPLRRGAEPRAADGEGVVGSGDIRVILATPIGCGDRARCL
jgi:hypothetical protein